MRYLLRHPWQLGLALLGVALGVAVVVAVDLANQSAGRAFDLSSEALTGRTTHQVLGGPQGIPERWYVELRRDHGVRTAAPVVEGYGRIEGQRSRSLRILGIDVFAEAAFRPSFGALAGSGELGTFMARPDRALLLSDDLARLGIGVGDTLPVQIQGRDRTLQVHAGLTPASALDARGLADVAVMDIAAAQELLGRVGYLDRVDLILSDSDAVEQVRQLLPQGAQLVEAEARNQALQEMTRAFQLNLTAFSMLALVVGAFLIYNTMTFSVVQRRPLLGMLRAVGVTRRELFTLVLGEALVIGVLGTIAGLVMGYAISHLLLELVTRTINDLYFVLSVRELALAPASIFKGVLLGLGMTVAAALAPALEATAVPARAALSRASLELAVRRRLPWLALAGLLLFVPAVALLLAGRGLAPAFAGLFLMIIGWALLAPLLMRIAMRLLAPLLGKCAGLLGSMAARGVESGLSRTSVAAAALMVAVSAVIGVGTMVDSFRYTFSIWLDSTLRADVYVSVPGGAALDPDQITALRGADGVARSSTARYLRVAVNDHRSRLRVFDLPPDLEDSFSMQSGNPGEAWRAFREGEGAMITEPYAWHRQLAVGDELTIATGSGERQLPVAGVVYDYSTSEGAVIIHRQLYERWWDDPVIESVALYLEDGQSIDATIDRLREMVADEPPLRYQSNRDIRRLSLDVFDQTFTITQVLRLLAMIVAVVGVLSALFALALERSREYAVLRATGLTPRQLWFLVTGQNALVGFIAGLLAIPLGLGMAVVLTLVINQRSFGWTMQVLVEPGILLQAMGLAVIAAVVAGLYPAWRMASTPPALALREDAG
nr:FtsX-like permease family protein [Natronocella acetinitrilica]